MTIEISDLVRSNIRILREIRAREYDIRRQEDPDLPSRNPFRKEHFHELCGLKAGQYKDLEYSDLPHTQALEDTADAQGSPSRRAPRISVDRLVAIASALGVNVQTLLLPPSDWVTSSAQVEVPAEDPLTKYPVLNAGANDYAMWILGLEPLPDQSLPRFQHHAFRLLPYLDRERLMDRDFDLPNPESLLDMEHDRDVRLPTLIKEIRNAPLGARGDQLLAWGSLEVIALNDTESRNKYMASLDYVDLVRYLLHALAGTLAASRAYGDYTQKKAPADEEMDEAYMEEAGAHFDAVLESVIDRLLASSPPPQGR